MSCWGKSDLWEELYDYESNTYFYRHRGTGEFSRQHPALVEAKSEHVPERQIEPIWVTERDPEGLFYWTDLETGRVSLSRPENGTFVSEIPLHEFRIARRVMAKESKRLAKLRESTAALRKSFSMKSKSIDKRQSHRSSKVVKRNDAYGLVVANSSDMDFEQMFGQASPAQFDAGALYAMGENSYVAPSKTNAEASDEEEKEVLDEQTILAQSTISTDNPLFRYG